MIDVVKTFSYISDRVSVIDLEVSKNQNSKNKSKKRIINA